MSRESSTALASRYGDHGPIAPDCWQPGPHSFHNASKVIGERVRAIKNERKREMADLALLGRLATHSSRNHGGFTQVQHMLGDTDRQRYQDVVSGDADAPEYIRFLRAYPAQKSIEVARLIHPGDWEVRGAIDTPVRTSLVDPQHGLDTQFLPRESHYKIVQFGDVFDMATVERKRVSMSHFGGDILTVVRNSVLIDTNHAPDDLKDHILQEKEKASKENYNYDQHSSEIQLALEDHMRIRDADNKPRWAIPLMTTYYAALQEEVEQN